MGLFPAGQRQATVELPALMLVVDAASVLNNPEIVEQVNQAAAAGATAIIMQCNTNDGQLYEAAVKLRELLRQRCVLLVQDRNDIANYAAADGVVLSAGGAGGPVPYATALTLCIRYGCDGAIMVPAAMQGCRCSHCSGCALQ